MEANVQRWTQPTKEEQMKNRERAVASCIETLKNTKVKFDADKRSITKGNYSLSAWAAIDCLTHYHGWMITN